MKQKVYFKDLVYGCEIIAEFAQLKPYRDYIKQVRKIHKRFLRESK